MKIVLLGYMASGKSVVGKQLSEQLNLNFIDLDSFIVEQEGMSIPTIFSKKGEIYFRKKETEYLKDIFSKKEGIVLSLGGGTPCYGENMNLVLENSQSFYLKSTLNNLHLRLKKESHNRPLVASIEPSKLKEFIAKHLFERTIFYERANHSIKTDNQAVQQVVNLIKNCLI